MTHEWEKHPFEGNKRAERASHSEKGELARLRQKLIVLKNANKNGKDQRLL